MAQREKETTGYVARMKNRVVREINYTLMMQELYEILDEECSGKRRWKIEG